MICSISLPITILNRLVILNDDISTEEIEITCSVIGIFRPPELGQVLILVQRSLSYCMIEDSIVKTGRHADVILLAQLGFQLIPTTHNTQSKMKRPSDHFNEFIRKLKLGSLHVQFEQVDDISPLVIICHSKHCKQLYLKLFANGRDMQIVSACSN